MTTILARLPHFYKVVEFPADLGLKLPDAFMKKYGQELDKFVFLKVPNGEPWQVELVHYENGCSVLQNGWKEFAEFYSIEMYHFLVFQYERNSQFRVLIFDPTASEINYPPPSSAHSDANEPADTTLKVEQEEIVEVHNHQAPQTSKGKMKQRAETKRDCPRTTKGKEPAQVKHSIGVNKKDMMQTKAKICREIFKLHKAKSSRPFFISFMHNSNVSQPPTQCRLEIPSKFLRKHLHIKKNCRFLLRVSKDGFTRNWLVFAMVDKYGGRGRVSRGFDKFVKDNGIKVNDVCVFELCRRQGGGDRAFAVTVYPSCRASK